MSAYIQIGFSNNGSSLSRNTRRNRRISRKYRKAASLAAVATRVYHHAA